MCDQFNSLVSLSFSIIIFSTIIYSLTHSFIYLFAFCHCCSYRVDTFPHIAVIDPRTGASIWVYKKKINAEQFSEKLMDFLGSNPYPDGE